MIISYHMVHPFPFQSFSVIYHSLFNLIISLNSTFILLWRDELQQEKQKQKNQQANATNKITAQVN